MREPTSDEFLAGRAGADYHDEHVWGTLPPTLGERGEKGEVERLTNMGVYEHVHRDVAEWDDLGKKVKVME